MHEEIRRLEYLERLLVTVNRKLDAVLRLQGMTLEEVVGLVDEQGDQALEKILTSKLKKAGDELKSSVEANEGPTPIQPPPQ